MKTTKKDFELFKQECLYWQKEFGLQCYELTFFHKLREKYVIADINASAYKGNASIALTTNHFSKIDVRKTAKHEMIHLLLQNLTDLTEERFTNKEEITQENEHIVRVLEKLIHKEN